MKRRQFLYGAAALGAVGATGYAISRGRPREIAPVAAKASAQPLWNLRLPDLAGQTQPLSQWRGQRTLVNFWATWCAPCVKEMPDLDALQKSRPDVRFLGIGLDSAENIRTFLAKVPVDYPIVMMDTGGIDLMRQLGNTKGGMPFTVILAEDGRIAHTVLGQISPEPLARLL